MDTFQAQNKSFIIETHSDFVVDRIRNAIARKSISNDDVSVLFFRRARLENKIEEIELNDLGDPILPPDDYRSFFVDEQMKILGM